MINIDNIKSALKSLQGDGFGGRVTRLLNELGYRSERIMPGMPLRPEEFVEMFEANSTKSEHNFVLEVQSIQVLFQISDSEIDFGQARLDNTTYDKNLNKSFLFVAVELKNTTHPRGRYAAFIREINKRLKIPAVVLFRTPNSKFTLGFVHRRESVRDPNQHVLERVSIIREIDISDPHRAHLDILNSLSMPKLLKWIDDNGKQRNFDGLHDAWLSALDVEELNKRFYRELYDWFERAVEQSSLPENIQSHQEHILRLITRLLFVWFVKQKGLVNDHLFNEHIIKDILADYDTNGDSYYRVVLQNLFFATLNREIGGRGFGNTNTSYHYKHEIKDSETLLEMFNQTPFINGGLFDCLDEKDNPIDYFVDNVSKRSGYSIPNQLFFEDSRESPGLITILSKYHFTVEESTPLEQEVALDPELLGRVFENLLAAYNPETSDTVRKQTGSYYTPREVVDYIIDKTLAASLAGKIYDSTESIEVMKKKIQNLLNYSTIPDNLELTDKERDSIVRAISEIKILDPAVGSGVFPMSVLHKLTLVLNHIDPENEIWRGLQIGMVKERTGRIFENVDTGQREEQLHQTNTIFTRYSGDFGRKLYLIQNNIYGVDIQPIATQITKLRFFISLVIEQDTNNNPEDNYGVQPLPNLETRFVAANTLIPLKKSAQQTLGQTDENVQRLELDLARNREQYFLASSPETKTRCRKNDKKLRKQLAEAVNKAGDAGYVNKMMKWDPFDQTNSSDWFDAKYMFGISNGFDSVIGNPPYIKQTSLDNKDVLQLPASNNLGYGEVINSKADISVYFFIHALNILKLGGLLGFINTDSWLHFKYGEQLQTALLQYCDVVTTVRPKTKIFRDAQIRTVVTIARRSSEHKECVTNFSTDFDEQPRTIRNVKPGNWLGLIQGGILPKPKVDMTMLGSICKITGGIETGHDAFYILSEADVALHGIDKKYLEPILTKPIEGHTIYETSPHKFLFHVQDHEGILVKTKRGKRVKRYIDSGKPKGTAKKDNPRYYVEIKETAPILISMQINEKVVVYENVARMNALRKFTYMTPKKMEHLAACLAYLSSSYFALYQEIWGHPMGGGLLKFQIEDYKSATVPNFSKIQLDGLNGAWESYKKSLKQEDLDEAVFDALGIKEQIPHIADSLSNLVAARLAAAETGKKW